MRPFQPEQVPPLHPPPGGLTLGWCPASCAQFAQWPAGGARGRPSGPQLPPPTLQPGLSTLRQITSATSSGSWTPRGSTFSAAGGHPSLGVPREGGNITEQRLAPARPFPCGSRPRWGCIPSGVSGQVYVLALFRFLGGPASLCWEARITGASGSVSPAPQTLTPCFLLLRASGSTA